VIAWHAFHLDKAMGQAQEISRGTYQEIGQGFSPDIQAMKFEGL
jgi:hypothetical protein